MFSVCQYLSTFHQWQLTLAKPNLLQKNSCFVHGDVSLINMWLWFDSAILALLDCIT